jgi:hypothetical protein
VVEVKVLLRTIEIIPLPEAEEIAVLVGVTEILQTIETTTTQAEEENRTMLRLVVVEMLVTSAVNQVTLQMHVPTNDARISYKAQSNDISFIISS